MPQLLEEILSLALYLLVITFLTIIQFWKPPKRKYPPNYRYSCRIVNGREVEKSKKYF